MGVITIMDGDRAEQAVADLKVYEFDFDADNLAAGVLLTGATPTVTVSAYRPSVATLPTLDNKAWVTGNRKARVRINSTACAVGAEFTVAIAAVTNESPAQTKNKAFRLQII